MNTESLEGDRTRRKRLKVVSACGECRRKKTKCNGEQPCTGCIKAKMECKYNTKNQKKDNSSMESIEERLGVIENILRTLLYSEKNKHLLKALPRDPLPVQDKPLLPSISHSPTIQHLLNDDPYPSAFLRLGSTAGTTS